MIAAINVNNAQTWGMAETSPKGWRLDPNCNLGKWSRHPRSSYDDLNPFVNSLRTVVVVTKSFSSSLRSVPISPK